MRVVAFIFLLLATCGCIVEQSVESEDSSGTFGSAEYAVLASIIDSVILGTAEPVLVVDDSTSCGLFSGSSDNALTALLQRIKSHTPQLKNETTLDFQVKNKSRWYIEHPVNIDRRCIRSNTTSLRYPMLSLSRVGISPDGQQALVYVGCLRRPMVGSGAFYVLALTNGKWRIVGTEMHWIS